MKRMAWIGALLLVAVVAQATDIITQDVKQLPPKGREFIEKFFHESPVSLIKIERTFLFQKEYEVLLQDRTEIEFDSRGNWTSVDCHKRAVPGELIPDYVSSYVSQNFPGEIITQIERDRHVEVELGNNLSLTFSKNGRLIEIDD